MTVGALICEYNPFHNGHKYMLDKMRMDGCDTIIAVMSGSFTQRGDVSVYSKFRRTLDALKGGVDLVIELPAVWAVASAQRFAQAGCDIIKSTGIVDRVYFGSESGDITLLKSVAKATDDEEVITQIKAIMLSQGSTYPTALQKVIEDVYDKEHAEVLSSPNNTLGIEYIKALKDSSIDIRTIKRTGVGHDSEETTDNIASASKIREMIFTREDFTPFIPEKTEDNSNPASISFGERALLLKLRKLTEKELEEIADVTEGLQNRILAVSKEQSSIEDILSEIKTKRYTHSRLRRILMCALLGIKKEHQNSDVPYLRILGFNSRGEECIKRMNLSATLPLVINVASGYNNLSEKAKEIFDIDVKATDIRTVFEKSPTACRSDFTHGIIKV